MLGAGSILGMLNWVMLGAGSTLGILNWVMLGAGSILGIFIGDKKGDTGFWQYTGYLYWR